MIAKMNKHKPLDEQLQIGQPLRLKVASLHVRITFSLQYILLETSEQITQSHKTISQMPKHSRQLTF